MKSAHSVRRNSADKDSHHSNYRSPAATTVAVDSKLFQSYAYSAAARLDQSSDKPPRSNRTFFIDKETPCT